jgi:hypothetical protein
MTERTYSVWKGMTAGSVTTHEGACRFCDWVGPIRKRGTYGGHYRSNKEARYMAVEDAAHHEDTEHPKGE